MDILTTTTIQYNVLTVDGEIVRTPKITGTFSIDSGEEHVIEELIERAYEREMMGSFWKSNFSIEAV